LADGVGPHLELGSLYVMVGPYLAAHQFNPCVSLYNIYIYSIPRSMGEDTIWRTVSGRASRCADIYNNRLMRVGAVGMHALYMNNM